MKKNSTIFAISVLIISLTTGCGHKRAMIKSLVADNALLVGKVEAQEVTLADLEAAIQAADEAALADREAAEAKLAEAAEALKAAEARAEAARQNVVLSPDQTRDAIACGDWSKLARRTLPVTVTVTNGKVECLLPPSR